MPAQVAVMTSQIIWTEDVEIAFEEFEAGNEDAKKKYHEICSSRLEGLIRWCRGSLLGLIV